MAYRQEWDRLIKLVQVKWSPLHAQLLTGHFQSKVVSKQVISIGTQAVKLLHKKSDYLKYSSCMNKKNILGDYFFFL